MYLYLYGKSFLGSQLKAWGVCQFSLHSIVEMPWILVLVSSPLQVCQQSLQFFSLPVWLSIWCFGVSPMLGNVAVSWWKLLVEFLVFLCISLLLRFGLVSPSLLIASPLVAFSLASLLLFLQIWQVTQGNKGGKMWAPLRTLAFSPQFWPHKSRLPLSLFDAFKQLVGIFLNYCKIHVT